MDSDQKGLIRILTVTSFSNHRFSHLNKYCTMCPRADATGNYVKDHKCYKNWSRSPNSMEADIIMEDF
ncbi:hypothetical protein PR048_001670 [Dryococelus australis]|uniref:Mutator-like transposase domain-containing protein n=1 Tax=Dryococelus australis TaxID=614101 RepID=A0ABQ9II49_9NEOP|nr:hypothetical protein PR048_001670 [Dryococelus australis]